MDLLYMYNTSIKKKLEQYWRCWPTMSLLFLLHVAIITEITQNLNQKLLKHYTKFNIKLADLLQNINTNYVAQI
jgi:hypothetical protein